MLTQCYCFHCLAYHSQGNQHHSDVWGGGGRGEAAHYKKYKKQVFFGPSLHNCELLGTHYYDTSRAISFIMSADNKRKAGAAGDHKAAAEWCCEAINKLIKEKNNDHKAWWIDKNKPKKKVSK